jgi:putative glutamine transport system substrate-binding protein
MQRHTVRFAVALAGLCRLATADPRAELYEVDTASAPAPAAGTPLDKMLKSLHLRACVRADVAPFGAFSMGSLSGFDVALASEVAEQISIDYKQPLRVQWVVVPAADRVKFVQDEACDILVAAFSHTAERATQVAESRVYLRTDKVLLAATKIAHKVPVIGKVNGTTGDTADLKGTIRGFASYQEVIQAMDEGELDYLVVDRPIADHLIRSATRPYHVAKTLAENAESYVIAVHKSHADVLAAVDKALEDLARSGRLALLHRRWL